MEKQLKVEKSHSKIYPEGISKIKKFIINTVIGAISLSICTGCSMARSNEEEKESSSYNVEVVADPEELSSESSVIIDESSKISNEYQSQKNEKEVESIEEDEEIEEDISEEDKARIEERKKLILQDIDPEQVIDCDEMLMYLYCMDKSGNYIEFTDEITVRDLQKIYSIDVLNVWEDSNLEWLNYCTNLNEIYIINRGGGNAFSNVHGMNLKNLEILDIREYYYNQDGYQNMDLNFLEELPNLKEFDYKILGENSQVVLNEIYKLKQLEKATIHIDLFSNVDVKKLRHLKELDINGDVYDVATIFTKEDINYLKNNGVKINLIKDYEEIDIDKCEELDEVNKRLDEIVEGLDIKENATDTEKLNEILRFAIEKYEYDEDVKERIYSGRDATNQEIEEENEKFYKYGYLYAALEGDSQICGNYAAMVQALANRVGLKSYAIEAPKHAFNLIKIDDNYYYVDATWLDEETISTTIVTEETFSTTYEFKSETAEDIFEKGEEERLNEFTWYKADPENYDGMGEIGDSHYAFNFPDEVDLSQNHIGEEYEVEIQQDYSQIQEDETYAYQIVNDESSSNLNSNIEDSSKLELSEQQEKEAEEKGEEISKKKFSFIFDNKKYIIPGGVLLTILAGLGAVKIADVQKRKRIEEERKRRQRNYSDYDYSSYEDYSKDDDGWEL